MQRLRGVYSAGGLPDRLLLQLATVRFLSGKPQDAIELLSANQEAAPTADAQHLLSNFYDATGRTADADAALAEALELDPAHGPARVEWGDSPGPRRLRRRGGRGVWAAH